MNILEILFIILLADSLIANALVWSGKADTLNHIPFVKRYIPLTRGWVLWYLLLVLFIGYLIFF
jgi:hypothetical protein